MSVLINKTLTVGDTGCTLEQIKTNKTNISNLTTTVNGIVTHGSNNNGSYTKFSNGTMICNWYKK